MCVYAHAHALGGVCVCVWVDARTSSLTSACVSECASVVAGACVTTGKVTRVAAALFSVVSD